MTGSVFIIILNWNGWQDTVECIESCRQLVYPDFSILIVDNGSSDGSEAILRNRFHDLELLQTGSNLGFAEGNNVGIRHALRQGAEYIWLLNNDTVVEPGTLSELVSAMDENRMAGMAGSKIRYFDEPERLWYAGASLDERTPYRCSHRGLNEVDHGQYDTIAETGYITGCSLLARRETIEGIGLLDEAMFLYFEDTDWCARARRSGWKMLYAPASVVYHKASASLGGMESPRMRYYLARNLLYFIRKNHPDTFFSALWFDFFQNVAVMVKKGRFAAAAWAWKGIIDFMQQRTGPLT